MAEYYEFNPFKRTVSIVVVPIDGYTGRLAAGKGLSVLIRSIGRGAIAKSDGYHVFTDIPPGLWELEILSGEFFHALVTADTREQSAPAVISVRLIPNGCYKLPAGASLIDCQSEEGAKMYAIPIGEIVLAKLRAITGNEISLRTATNADLSNQLLAFYENGDMEVFETGERTRKNTYRHNKAFAKQYQPGALIYPVSEGKSDEKGRLFCPVRGVCGEHTEVVARLEGAKGVCYKRFIISGGKGGCLIPEA